MGAILLGSNGQVTEESSILIPEAVNPDQILLTESITVAETVPETPSSPEHIEAENSIIQLASEGEIPEQGVLDSIALPETTPSPELVGSDPINPVDNTIELPNTIPLSEGILTEDDDSIQIPDSIPSGEEILIEGVTLVTPVSGTSTTITGDKYYKHTQSVASDTWNVYHNLQKRPAVHIEDATGQEIISQIVHVTNNYLRVYFGKPYVGTAHCN